MKPITRKTMTTITMKTMTTITKTLINFSSSSSNLSCVGGFCSNVHDQKRRRKKRKILRTAVINQGLLIPWGDWTAFCLNLFVCLLLFVIPWYNCLIIFLFFFFFVFLFDSYIYLIISDGGEFAFLVSECKWEYFDFLLISCLSFVNKWMFWCDCNFLHSLSFLLSFSHRTSLFLSSSLPFFTFPLPLLSPSSSPFSSSLS